jgi:hypothetical protein
VEALVDNDIIIALARFDLMVEFDTITRGKCTRPHRCVPAARNSLRLSDPLWARYPSKAIRETAKSFFAGCKALGDKPLDICRFSQLLKAPGIDQGEAYLFDYACANADALVVTGDKNSTKALAADPALADIARALKGRIVHLECLIDSMIGRFGLELIRSKICADLDADKTLARLLDKRHHEKTARANLSIHLQTLEADLSEMLRLPL